MKTEIKRIDDKQFATPGIFFWSCRIFCDKCGKECYLSEVFTSTEPDKSKPDFCIDCYRELMDKKISYEEAMKLYKKDA